MKLVIKGNSERKIPDEKLNEYLEMGYSEIDTKGNVIQEGKINEPAKLESLLTETRAKLAAAEEVNASLAAENEDLRAKLAAAVTPPGGGPGEGQDGEIPGVFACEFCDKTYKTETALKAHITKAHSNQ